MSSNTQNDTATIESTIRTALNGRGLGSYFDQYAQPVVAALVEREEAITEKLVGYAEANGADTEEVTAMLNDLGMAVKAPEPEADNEDGSDESDGSDNSRIASALGRIEEQISRLTDFARRNGYRG